MSFITFRNHMLLNEVAARPRSKNLFFEYSSITSLSFGTRTELSLFFDFLVLLLYNFNFLVLEQSDMVVLHLNFTYVCIQALYNPGCYYKHNSYFNLLSSYAYVAPLKGFFD